MLEGKDYCAVDMEFPILCVSFDRVTGYTKSARITLLHPTYGLLVSKAVSVT